MVLRRFGSSGLDVEAFCRREAISVASFYRRCGILGSGPGPLPRLRLEFKLDLGDGLVLHLVRG